MTKYRIHYEAVDVEADTQEHAIRKVKFLAPDINKIIIVNNSFD